MQKKKTLIKLTAIVTEKLMNFVYYTACIFFRNSSYRLIFIPINCLTGYSVAGIVNESGRRKF
jgi:hypothetical protein